MSHIPNVKPPSTREIVTLRVMICLGLVAMVLFMKSMLDPSIRGSLPLYWMLMFTFFFTCLKLIHEWCHYFYITVPETPPETKLYTVDIFTTFCAGEPYEMITETLTAIQAITYPHKTYLCDEADDPYLRDFCHQIGVHHVTRTLKINAKAGNINNALALSTGELCVVLDPDHVPFSHFLDPIVTHFNDPKVGFVQIVQAYKNNDEGLIAKGAAQQTYQFYGPMMMTMNKYGTVLAIGANCTFRRKALESIGGHAAGLAEDMHTSMQLHAKGWKSVYVPNVLARGLVPSTLSAYYKQQLKWSRGVFDLLVTAYPALFKKFTWQQKIHYAAIPLHYLSGIIFLINFLIPVIALFFGVTPMKMDISAFASIGLPLAASIILIRHFVQWWVMEDEERGFHMVGGLLMIGTWWIFILGFVYTIMRKNVPYVPTPKDGKEDDNWPLNIPNIAILVLSVVAVTYGLYTDWNPYNLIMSGFAMLNCLFMCFNIAAARQEQFRVLKSHHPVLHDIMKRLKKVKGSLWIVRRRIYAGIRSTALLITLLLTTAIIFLRRQESAPPPVMATSGNKADLFLTGTALIEEGSDLIPLTLPWENEKPAAFPIEALNRIYQNGSVPMLRWDPAQDQQAEARKIVFSQIVQGNYDNYLLALSNVVKSLDRPVYIQFAPEADRHVEKWPTSDSNNPETFKAAWKYIHAFFSLKRVNNVIWVWTPGKADAVNAYFPGIGYVDWISVRDDASFQSAKQRRNEKDLYGPYHQTSVFQSGLPVLLEINNTRAAPAEKHIWQHHPYDLLRASFPEVKGILYKGTQHATLNSRLELNNRYAPHSSKKIAKLTSERAEIGKMKSASGKRRALFEDLRGINYNKGQDWTRNYHALTKKELTEDFEAIKLLGMNTVKFHGPGFYDHNLLTTAKNKNLDVHYAFWVDPDIDFRTDKDLSTEMQLEILERIEKLQSHSEIVSWNIGNTIFEELESRFYKPELIYQQQAYLLWLHDLAKKIKTIDPVRKLTLDINLSEKTPALIQRIAGFIPEIDAYGIKVTEQNASTLSHLNELKVPYFFTYCEVPVLEKEKRKTGVFISNWQDSRSTDEVTFDGLQDHHGRKKVTLLKLSHLWKGTQSPGQFPNTKILTPSLATFPGATLTYHALCLKKGNWIVAGTLRDDLHFEWKLVRNDQYGDPIEIKDAGEGPSLSLIIPEYPLTYELYLYSMKGRTIVDIVHSKLNTPLIVKEE